LVLLALGPAFVAWWGKDGDAPVRLRVLGLAVVVVASWAWDDRVHALTAASPVGLPAVRRGRAVVVGVLLLLAFASGVVAVPAGVEVPVRALALQTVGLVLLQLTVIGAAGRYGDPVLTLSMPVLLLWLAVLYRMPDRVQLLRADPSGPGWAAARTRWLVVAAVAAAVVSWWARDPAARRVPLLPRSSGASRRADHPGKPRSTTEAGRSG
jgi:hypothetical protein